jgi:regulator of replication initiation timing
MNIFSRENRLQRENNELRLECQRLQKIIDAQHTRHTDTQNQLSRLKIVHDRMERQLDEIVHYARIADFAVRQVNKGSSIAYLSRLKQT